MLVFYLLAAYTSVCGFLLFVLLMGQSPSFRDTCVGSINRVLRNLPQSSLYFLMLLFSCFNKDKARKSAHDAEVYCMDKPNPIIQIFYAILVFPSLYFFFTDIAPKMEKSQDVWTVAVVSVISVGFYCAAWLCDPGTVLTEEDEKKASKTEKDFNRAQNERFARDGLHYSEERNDCLTCHVTKPARSKHCKICNRCVRRFDHHCPWINSDVGENNLKWFHAFLVSHVIMSGIVCFWSGWILYSYIHKERLFFARYARGRGITNDDKIEELRPSWYIVLLYAMSQNSVAAGLCLFAGMVSILLFGFWWMNFVHVVRNETTNEMHKREDIVDMIKARDRQIAERKRRAEEEEAKAKENRNNDNNNDGGASEKLEKLLDDDERRDNQPPQITMKDVMNTRHFYGNGSYFRNVVEAFFVSTEPSCEEARPKKQNRTGGAAAVSSQYTTTTSSNNNNTTNNNKRKQKRK